MGCQRQYPFRGSSSLAACRVSSLRVSIRARLRTISEVWLSMAGLREGRSHCVDSQGASVPCCEWSPSPWARTYMSVTSLVLLWTVSKAVAAVQSLQ